MWADSQLQNLYSHTNGSPVKIGRGLAAVSFRIAQATVERWEGRLVPMRLHRLWNEPEDVCMRMSCPVLEHGIAGARLFFCMPFSWCAFLLAYIRRVLCFPVRLRMLPNLLRRNQKGNTMNIRVVMAALAASCVISGTAFADVFGFEDVAGPLPSSTKDLQVANSIGAGAFQTASGSVNASLEYFFDSTPYDQGNSGYWAGGAVSNSKLSTGTGQNNDLNVKPGGAASGNNFAVLYLPTSDPNTWAPYRLSEDPKWGDAYCSGAYEGFPNVTSLLVDTPVEFYSIDVTLTSYVYESLVNGDAVIGRVDPDDPTSDFKNIYNTDGAFYVLRIYELDSAGEWTDNYEDVVLAQNIDGEVSGLIENADQWLTVDISGLNSDGESAGLGFSIISSFSNDYGMTAPAYVAIDNVVFNVPEPSECAVLAGALVLAFVYLRRRFAR